MSQRTFWLILIGAALIIAGAAVAYANRPAAAVERAFTNLAKATTADFSTQINIGNSTATSALLGEEGSIDLVLDGVWAEQAGPDALSTKVTFTTQTESVSIKIKGEVRLVDDKLYFLITNTPPAFPALVQLKGQWLAIDRGASQGEAASALLTADKFSRIDRVGVEKIGDEPSVHYAATATDEAIIGLMDNLAGILGTSLSADQISQIRDSVSQVKTVPLDIWIKRWGSDIRQLKATIAVPGGNSVQFTLRFNQLNQEVSITAPSGAKSLQELSRP